MALTVPVVGDVVRWRRWHDQVRSLRRGGYGGGSLIRSQASERMKWIVGLRDARSYPGSRSRASAPRRCSTDQEVPPSATRPDIGTRLSASLLAAQAAVESWVADYNCSRPRQGLDMACPAEPRRAMSPANVGARVLSTGPARSEAATAIAAPSASMPARFGWPRHVGHSSDARRRSNRPTDREPWRRGSRQETCSRARPASATPRASLCRTERAGARSCW